MLKELSRSYLTISKDLGRVMNRLKALYRSWAHSLCRDASLRTALPFGMARQDSPKPACAAVRKPAIVKGEQRSNVLPINLEEGSPSSGVPASRASRIRARPRRRRLDRSRTRNSPTLSSTERLALPSAWRPTPAAVPRRKRLRPFNSLPVTRTAMSSRYHACFF